MIYKKAPVTFLRIYFGIEDHELFLISLSTDLHMSLDIFLLHRIDLKGSHGNEYLIVQSEINLIRNEMYAMKKVSITLIPKT